MGGFLHTIIIVYSLLDNFSTLAKQEITSISINESPNNLESHCGRSSYTPTLPANFNVSEEESKMRVSLYVILILGKKIVMGGCLQCRR